jgi:murein tripeptide amidase MpaA
MSFAYDFAAPHDCVHFAYCVPYSYSQLLKSVAGLPNAKPVPALKSLSGLSIPVLEVTDEEVAEYNKKVILVTGRIHPGESNSSFVAEGMLEFLCGMDQQAKELRKSYIFYVIPMLNPDGVVAGNYRTSFFGKDLNRTFDQSRKYAFP